METCDAAIGPNLEEFLKVPKAYRLLQHAKTYTRAWGQVLNELEAGDEIKVEEVYLEDVRVVFNSN